MPPPMKTTPPKKLQREKSASLFATTGKGNYGRTLVVPIQLWRKYGIVLLWAAVGIDLLVSKAGYPVLGQAISMICVSLYLAEYVSLRKAMCSFWFTMMDVFFREISVGGAHKVTCLDDGRAVIFACAPHVNQFLDPIVVMKVVAQVTGRHVSWMTAAKSFNRAFIGVIARALKGIPVVRPDDNETKGKGFVTTEGTKVYGHMGTQFIKDFKKGAVLVVKGKGSKRTAKVANVISDYEMELTSPMKEQREEVKVDKTQDFHRAPSEFATMSLTLAIFLPVAFFLLSIETQLLNAIGYVGAELHRTWPVMLLVSLQISTLIVSLIYTIMRQNTPAPLGHFTSEPNTPVPSLHDSSTPTPSPHTSGSDLDKTSPFGSRKPKTHVGAPLLPFDALCDVTEQSAYSFLPYVDQSEMFEKVHEFLNNGGTVGIFPEGGTHDGTTLLPLKWGISTMLLGALAKTRPDQPPVQISVVPVGLNYFRPHDFRSTVSVDFGDPIEVDVSLAEQWKKGTKEEQQEANIAVMELIMAGVNACTLQAKDVETLELFRTIRRLYVPLGARLSVADNVALTQGVSYGFEKIKEEMQVRLFLDNCISYNNMLHQTGVADYQVQRFQERAFSKRQRTALLLTAVYRLCVFLIFGVLLLPWYVCVSPAALVVSTIADQQARKVNKRSVMGTWKVLAGVGFVPLYHCFTTSCIWFTLGDMAGLSFFFLAPFFGILAIVATEEGFRLFRSLRSLLFVLKNKDAGQQLCVLRESLKQELHSLQEEYHWLHGLDLDTKQRLEKRQSLTLKDTNFIAAGPEESTN
mmetsp:Transcript_15481/g.36454  ORF Transcript_15481/g.36454 Transcript_15481/m.36454 type:complete len:802 (-) Transcript_15481:311-2716(-)